MRRVRRACSTFDPLEGPRRPSRRWVLSASSINNSSNRLKYLVECDIVLPEDMPLKEAHDIGEQLQIKIEKMEDVERAFVHLDYEWDHKAEHGDPYA